MSGIKRGKLDIVFSLLIRERAGNVCEVTGQTPETCQLECCHVEGRRSRSTRWHPDNAFCLSHATHRHFTENPIAWTQWVKGKIGAERYQLLYRMAHTPRKFSPRELEGLYQHYKRELERLLVARSNGRTGRIEFFWPDPIPEATPRAKKKKAPSKFKKKLNGQVVLREDAA